MAMRPELHDEIDRWFSQRYFKDFIAISAGKLAPVSILSYWSVPLHTSNHVSSRWFTTSHEVVGVLENMQSVLTQAGYTYTEMLDKKLTVYGENASRVETIMSRRRADDIEIDRAAICFEIRRAEDSWTIISTVMKPTGSLNLKDVW